MNIIELEQHLILQQQQSQQLIALLEQENHALIEREPEKIQALAESKQQLLIAINDCDQKIKLLLAPDLTLPAELLELKTSIDNNIKLSQQKNEINGRAIDLSISSIERLQSSLIKKRAGNSMTYNQKGKTQGSSARGGYISA
ncbi:MAG: flagellar protein FlgN [Gammaproteobacteria bacterium]|nr:flagellar protein FlgN [Gammaproteobacteria bacterium]